MCTFGYYLNDFIYSEYLLVSVYIYMNFSKFLKSLLSKKLPTACLAGNMPIIYKMQEAVDAFVFNVKFQGNSKIDCVT